MFRPLAGSPSLGFFASCGPGRHLGAGTAPVTPLGPPGRRGPALAAFVRAVAPLTVPFFVAVLPGEPLSGALPLVGAGRFALTGAYGAGPGPAVRTAAGRLGLLAAFALYGGFGLLQL
ncbi:hypothetical protein [Streptomyces sp. KHY 26]|uniref:hypothetical protein n=1 Tax=Streptomyces sp. KHY 26 TaxID=3097359 RepID=UPI00376EE6EA